jgi:hypothetical protein
MINIFNYGIFKIIVYQNVPFIIIFLENNELI